MDARRHGTVVSAWVMAAALAVPAGAAENLFPDPGFESTGVEDAARSGRRCGVLRADAKQHWRALGGDLRVEPLLLRRENPAAEKELWLRGDACPAGEWAIQDRRRGIALLNRFDRSAIAFCY